MGVCNLEPAAVAQQQHARGVRVQGRLRDIVSPDVLEAQSLRQRAALEPPMRAGRQGEHVGNVQRTMLDEHTLHKE